MPVSSLPAARIRAMASITGLHVAVARAGDAAGRQGHLHEAGAIEAQAGLAAPQIGRADKALGDGNEIGLIGIK
jgi:hypothetical protein